MWVEALLLVLLFLLLKKVLRKPDGLPPGRWGLPLVGYIPLLDKRTMLEQLQDLRKQYGDVYTWRVGTQLMIFIHDYKLIKEAYSKSEVTERPKWWFYNVGQNPGLGISGSNGERWHNNRRFTLRQLRDLGMGKSRLVEAVHRQASMLVEELKKQSGQPAPIPHALNVAIINVIWQMVAGIQFEVDDPEMKKFQRMMLDFFVVTDRLIIPDLMPWLLQIMPKTLADRIFKMDHAMEMIDKFFNYFKAVMDEHRATLDRDNPRDLIDSYLMDMDDNQDDPESMLHEKDLSFIIFDLFFAGSQTTADTLKFTFYYLANNPRVQSKLQAELDETLGGALATLEDRSRLPYTEAVIQEAMRMSTLTPIGLHHIATKDLQLGGYHVPKGTVFNTMAISVHYDPNIWEDPHQFLPERWMDDKGHFAFKREGFMAFSIGKRQCVGEALARMELLIVLAAVMANFTITPPPGKIIDCSPDPASELFHVSRPQDIVFTHRKQ
ncbi:hypothetical protein Pmani_001275 [Petrolisthes manimaculis]|uniref:Cytochrome P450 n=1 Tax=Petrolisthes manimaculis TaxID=1843537 RepID=A0AAE1QKA3_9EUCA|nr:hypothetical protein Pmani_001275 [Petrolisthes manimaculis]